MGFRDLKYLYENAKSMANAHFNQNVLVMIQNRIENAPFDRDEILKEYSRNAIKAYESNIFVDERENEIISNQDIADYAYQWDDIIAGKDVHEYSNWGGAPDGYSHDPMLYIISVYADALLQKMTMEYCKAELMPTKNNGQYAEKWYGITHKILQFVNIAPLFLNPNDKKAIMNFGITEYKLETTGREFYNGWKNFDLLNIPREINSLRKDRNRWKKIILSIAKDRNEVALWLKKQPE